jgi:hypothetical protein
VIVDRISQCLAKIDARYGAEHAEARFGGLAGGA